MHLIGVDLGRRNDFAAPVIFEDELYQKPVTIMPDGTPPRYRDVPSLLVRRYNLVDMMQWTGVSYPMTAKRIKNIVDNPQVSRDYILAVDATGVGQAVIDMLRGDYNLNPIGVTFTSGAAVTMSQYGYNVPKRDLVVNLQLLFQLERVRIAEELELAKEFKGQLEHYSSHVNERGYESFAADAEIEHDDLPMAAAIILWYAEKVMAHRIELPQGEPQKPFNPATHGLTD
jgi:hypothetical protein